VLSIASLFEDASSPGMMVLNVDSNIVSGFYHTSVGDAKGLYELVGRIDTTQDGDQVVGWVVSWQNQFGSSGSVTSWSGQYRIDKEVEAIVTTWLLTSETDPLSDWHSTLIGCDRFWRTPQTPENILQNTIKGVKKSNPIK
jgi:hypothetical protein